MKKYKLLKDLPFAKAGDILSLERSQEYGYFKLCKDRSNPRSIELYEGIVEGFIDNFGEWFEEIKEPKRIYYANDFGCNVANMTENNNSIIRKSLKSVGNHFETYKEAKAYLEYLKAKAIIKQDTKGFKPNWNNIDEAKYYGYWDFRDDGLDWGEVHISKNPNIYFKSNKDIKESFRKHPKEWKTYLTYEQ